MGRESYIRPYCTYYLDTTALLGAVISENPGPDSNIFNVNYDANNFLFFIFQALIFIGSECPLVTADSKGQLV